jgi:hypothetical protein
MHLGCLQVEMLPYQANVYNTTVANYRAEVSHFAQYAKMLSNRNTILHHHSNWQ